MKSNAMKTFAIAFLLIFFATGISLADGWKDGSAKQRHAYGHYTQGVHHHYRHYAPPRPVYVEHHHRPILVERHYYREPVYHAAPAPRGFFFGMSVAAVGSAVQSMNWRPIGSSHYYYSGE